MAALLLIFCLWISKRSPDVPPVIRRVVVQVDVERTIVRPVVRVATTVRHPRTQPNPLSFTLCVRLFNSSLCCNQGTRLRRFPSCSLRLQFTSLCEWFTRKRSPDGPPEMRRAGAQVDEERTSERPVGRVATTERHPRTTVVEPESITVIFTCGTYRIICLFRK